MNRFFCLLSVLCLALVGSACKQEAPPTPPPERIIEYHLQPTAAVEGTIDVPDGVEPFGIMVFAEGTSNMSFTDAKGEFLITDLDPGDYVLRAMRHDLQSLMVAEISIRDADLEKDQPFLTLKGVEMKPRELEGKSGAAPEFAALGNLRGLVLTTNPTDSKGVLVEITGTDMRTVTDASGSFVFYNLPSGDYGLNVSRSGYETKTARVHVFPGLDNPAGEIRLDVVDIAAGQGRTIFGRVEMFDAQENPVAEFDAVTVYLEGTEFQARPDAAGQYQFGGIPAGRYVVTASAPGYAIAQRYEVDLTEIEAVEVNPILRPTEDQVTDIGSVVGRVILEESPTGGNGGVAVSLAGTSSIAITDQQGTFRLLDIPEGMYDLVATMTGYETAYIEGIEVVAAQETQVGTIEMKLERLAPEVVGTLPEPGALDVPIEQPTEVIIQFNMKMNQRSLVDAINVSPDVDYRVATAGRHARASEDRVVVLLSGYSREGKVLRFDTKYTVEVGTAVTSIDGVPMKEPYSFSFTTGSARVIATRPDDGAEGAYVSPTEPILIHFNAPISVSKFNADDIRIRPDIGTVPSFEVQHDSRTGWGTLQIVGRFEWETEYTVRIGKGIETITGDRIENLPYTFKFTTREVTENFPYNSDDVDTIERQRKERDRH
ncbi:carboxypeptidase regulatory-like domain-containing protein [bacterium]|nr:carboxypeptidase regulatory-like domain-containing protein [bacterium]